MKNVSKIVQLALICVIVLTGQQMFAEFGSKKKAEKQSVTDDLKPVYKTKQEIAQEKQATAQQQRMQQEAQRKTGIRPSAPSIAKGNLYPMINTPTPPSTPRTTTSTSLPPKRKPSSKVGKQLTKEELAHIKYSAELIQQVWSIYLLSIQKEESEGFNQSEWNILQEDLVNLENTIKKLNNTELNELYLPIKKVFSAEDIWNIEIVATHLYNLISALNQFADTSYDLTDIAQYLEIEAEEHPLYGAYGGFTDWLYSWGDKPREAWSSAKQTASSAWESARQKVQYAKSFVGQPSEEEFNAATARLAEIKRIEQIAEIKRTKTDQALLDQYKLTESRDRAMIAKWWPYLVTVATAGAFYYMFPEFSKNVAGYGIGAAGYVAKPALASAAAYGGYRLLESDQKNKSTKKRGIEKLTPTKK